MKKGLIFIGVLIGLVLLFWGLFKVYQIYSGPSEKTVFRTEKAGRGDLIRSITATGTVEPEELVNVGAQVQGMITKFGMDTAGKSVDYGSIVKAGQVLALIDDSLYRAELKSAEASQLQAKAAMISAKANILQMKAKLELCSLNLNRAKQLLPNNAIAKNTFDSAMADYDIAEANLAAAEASLKQAEAQLASANASQERAARNLSYCVINSPVDGVIIDRRVNIGQTVVSSMSAPSLFLIAKDLRKMQVWVSVNEADVGQIKIGQDVRFTVDAFQGLTFTGKVRKIRLNATMSQNVVTYVVEVETDNSKGILLPYLTANVKFILIRRNNVITLPNSALRFVPDPSVLPEKYRSLAENPVRNKGERTVWVKDGSFMKPVKVRTGASDGVSTEITEGLEEGMEVISGVETVTVSKQKVAASGASKSPFLPSPPPRAKRKK